MRSNDGTVEIPLPPAESVCVRGSISRRRRRRRRAHRRFHCGHVPYQKTASAVSPPRKRRTNRLKAFGFWCRKRGACPPKAGRIGPWPNFCGYCIISAGRKAVRPLRGAAGPARSRAEVMQQAQRAASAAQAPPKAGRIGPWPDFCGYYIIMARLVKPPAGKTMRILRGAKPRGRLCMVHRHFPRGLTVV